MTRTDNNDGTWDVLFDNDAEVLLDIDIDMYSDNTIADNIWCPVKRETKYCISIGVPTGRTLKDGKELINTAFVETDHKPYVVGNFFCYTTKVKNATKTIMIPYHRVHCIEIVCEEKEILRIADGKNPLLFHYRYGEPTYRTVIM